MRIACPDLPHSIIRKYSKASMIAANFRAGQGFLLGELVLLLLAFRSGIPQISLACAIQHGFGVKPRLS
jgi:hypothetical protein